MAKRRRFAAKFKAEIVLEALRGESSQAELCRRHNLSENQVSRWKRHFLERVSEAFFQPSEKHADAERIAQLEHLVGRLTLTMEIEEKSSDTVELKPSQRRHLIEALRKEYSVRQICKALGFNRSTFYYQPKTDPFEAVLRAEIERLAAASPTDGYRRITHLLVKAGYRVGYRRVYRLMKAANLSVSVKSVY